ncbi:MAG: glutamine--tRNA ligase/YqeY domain fusion protein [Bacillota bacterium]|jgi:glutaminyl-tRNA synthetase|nr:glutamine--tRNA ligase/YqeY domain fusion protein [Bacillota bacterium]NLM07514.1 glutamine--tRNA ligase/YqeY domain fusion protein [Clostridiales Family XIII bacterium]
MSDKTKENINVAEEMETSNFIHNIIDRDLENKTYGDRPIYTRFPPEPNGYLHIGHAKAICLNFTTAQKYGGKCNLRFDDTNPLKEDTEYVESIKEDVRWLGFQWDKLLFASDYFDRMIECAFTLIKKGKAYVCDLSAEEIREYRGTLTKPGKESPYRNRSVEKNFRLFQEMIDGKYKDGEKVLRAKIDMASSNINMRDPVIYRIAHATHHNTGDKYCVYPMYDYAHPLEDAFEEITHSLCTLEFEDHRPLYDWVLRELDWEMPPQQIEFARLNLTNTVMSKRYLKELVEKGHVEGWDDPRMPTIAGLRRRGYTPEAIRDFCERIGVSKANSTVDISLLEHCIREDLKTKVETRMVVLDPLKVVITNYPEDLPEEMEIENSKENEAFGNRKVPFSRELYVERDDFMEVPVKKFFRLYPGNEVRLKGAYFIKCNEVIKDSAGNVIELRCTYDPETRSGSGFEGRKVKGTIHWVDAKTAVPLTVRVYDYLMIEDENGENVLNPNSLKIMNAMAEPSLADAKAGDRFQFLRKGYYIADPVLYTEENRVFNQIVDLKSSWKK